MKSLGVLLVLGWPLASCESGAADPHNHGSAVAVSPIDQGKQLYTTLCVQCHGANATGYKSDHAPSLVNPTFLESATNEYLTKSIELGRPGTAMAGYGKSIGGPLPPDGVAKIVLWLRSQGSAPAQLAAATAGDATRGAPIYAKNCQKCHGDQATRGDSVHLANARFLELATDPFLTYAIVHGRPGTPMLPWQGKLDEHEISDVVAFVRTLGKPGVIGELPAPTGTEPLFVNPTGTAPTFKLRADPCGKPPCKEDPRFVSIDQVKAALDDHRKLVIIDARPSSEWMHVHITGAISIPYHDMKRLDQIPKDAWVVAYCACPHHLSGIVVDELRKRGYAHAEVLDEGILEWQRRNYTVVAAPGVTAPPKESAFGSGVIP